MFEVQVFNTFGVEGCLQICPESSKMEIILKDILSTLEINHENNLYHDILYLSQDKQVMTPKQSCLEPISKVRYIHDSIN